MEATLKKRICAESLSDFFGQEWDEEGDDLMKLFPKLYAKYPDNIWQKEGSDLSEKIGQLKIKSIDVKAYKTDVADTGQLFRPIQSIPSPKAEPVGL